jgi:hypothetical protein
MDSMKYFRRRQFALGPEYFNFDGWQKYQLDKVCCLTVHPDLTFQIASSGKNFIALLGYLIDPENKDKTETLILNDIIHKVESINDIFTVMERMCGRYVCIVKIDTSLILFHDAVGLRQVNYCLSSDGHIWCASQAETLADRFGFSLDQEVMEFRNSPMFKTGKSEFWLMNTRTPYREVLQLLPNHYLDLQRGKSIRFWPTTNTIPPQDVDNAIQLVGPILKTTIEAACAKFDLKMGVTAGIDSRKTLAAVKDIKDKITYFTIEHNMTATESVDVKIARRLLRKLGLRHQIVKRQSMSGDFLIQYHNSYKDARDRQGEIAYTLACNFGTEFTLLNSNTSEITQCNYWLPKRKINGEGLTIITGFYHPLAIREYNKWIEGARGPCEEAGLNILALFHWEQRGGRWAAASFNEYDITHESFTPYNNRYLNILLLGVSERYRRNRMWYLAIKIISEIWPDVLSEPINPGITITAKTVEFIRRQILHRFVTPWFPIYEYIKYLRKKKRAKLTSHL